MRNKIPRRFSFNKSFIKIFGVIIVGLFLFSFFECSANPISILPGDVAPVIPGPDSGEVSLLTKVLKSLGVLCLNFLINSIVLCLVYLILKQKNLIKSFRFLKYILFVTLGGALIDFIYVGGQYMRYNIPILFDLSVLLTFLGLGVYNFWLCRKIFGLSREKALFVGLAMAVFTNPVLGLFL